MSERKTVAAFIEGLTIFAKYMSEGVDTKYFCGAEHDEIFIYVGLDECAPDSEDGKHLQELGFNESGADNWSWMT